jgi:glycerophosphoryl diester phosphodiesterase
MPSPRRQRPLLLGHRGVRALHSIPENTFAAFDQALADGCDGFEFDVRLTVDGLGVICHDPRYQGREIASASAEAFPDLPRLEQVLARYADRAFLDIELKVPGLERITVAGLNKYAPHRGYVVSSFLPEVLHTIHAEDSRIPLGLIAETATELLRWTELEIDYVIPHHKLADPTLIAKLKATEKKILVWTVNSPADMKRFRHAGVDGIISDDTKLLAGRV